MNLIQQIRQIYVPVHDLDRAVRFYRDTLQFPLLFQAGQLAFLECSSVRLMLSRPENEDFAKASSVLYLQVGNLDEAYEQTAYRIFTSYFASISISFCWIIVCIKEISFVI